MRVGKKFKYIFFCFWDSEDQKAGLGAGERETEGEGKGEWCMRETERERMLQRARQERIKGNHVTGRRE